MAGQLQSASIAAPGFFGLNTQESGITLESGFALEATNCVIDKFGRLGARKGWQYLVNTNGINLEGLHRFIDIDGTKQVIVWSSTTFYEYTGTALTALTYAGSQTLTEGNWQAVTLNDAVYFFQRGYEPLYHDTVTNNIKDISQAATTATVTIVSQSTTATVTHSSHGLTTGTSVTFAGANQSEYNGTFTITVVDVNTYTYTLPSSATSPATGTITATWSHGTAPQGNTALAAYGRLWVADTTNVKTTLYWSNLLDGTDFLNGTAGSLDISGILVYGNDEIVGLGAHNGFLIVFCKKNIIIFGDTDNNQQYLDPVNLQLVEVISGVGCIARDSIQNTGTDILFLSESGLRSLGRVIQEKSTPMRDLSKNIRDDLVQILDAEIPSKIKSVYSEHDAFYLLTFPTSGKVYCFDARSVLEDGSARATIWNNMEFTNWLAFEDNIYMTHANGLATYNGYQDNGSSYRLVYFTNYFDLGSSVQTKILKRLAITIIGATGQDFVVKSGFDYSDQYNSYPLQVQIGTVSEYNIAEYNIAEFSGSTLVDNVRIPGSGSGSVLQLGFEADLNGGALSIQKMDVYVKQGRTI